MSSKNGPREALALQILQYFAQFSFTLLSFLHFFRFFLQTFAVQMSLQTAEDRNKSTAKYYGKIISTD